MAHSTFGPLGILKKKKKCLGSTSKTIKSDGSSENVVPKPAASMLAKSFVDA